MTDILGGMGHIPLLETFSKDKKKKVESTYKVGTKVKLS